MLRNIIRFPKILPLCSDLILIPILTRTTMKLLLALFFCSVTLSSSDTVSLDASVQESALRTLTLTRHRHHTGSPYRAVLPPTLSGVEVSVLRLRTNTLWRKGSSFGHFTIPPRTVPVPHVKRLLIVYHNLGNCSSQYYAVRGFSFATSVVGFSVYDASNISSTSTKRIIDLDTSGRAISVRFRDLNNTGRQRCVFFKLNGNVVLGDMTSPDTCFAREQGRFSIVAPLEPRGTDGKFWAIGAVLGSVGLSLGSCLVVVLCRGLRSKKVRVMEREADDGELFGNVWVSGSKMPSATGTRTQPSLDDGGFA